MDWLYPKRRGPEWKQGWTGQTLASISAPPLHLLAIFAIVVFLLSLSQYTTYKAQLHHNIINFQLFLFLLPVLLILCMRSSFVNARFFRLPRPHHDYYSIHRSGGSPWGVAVLVALLLLLLSYQSTFHSKWFRPLWRSD